MEKDGETDQEWLIEHRDRQSWEVTDESVGVFGLM